MRYLISILIFISPVYAQRTWDEMEQQIEKDKKTEAIILLGVTYGLGATFSFCDASQDAITYSPNNTTRWFNHGDYHALKTYRNLFALGSFSGFSYRVALDYSYKRSTWDIVRRSLVRVVGMGSVNWIVWDISYLSNKGNLNLDPRYYRHWSGIDFLDKRTTPKTKLAVAGIWIFKLSLVGLALSFEEL